MESRYDTYCGLYCGACAVLVANESGEIEKKAKEWGEKPADLRCFGCKSNTNSVYCRECELKQCAESKKVEFCFKCDEFPCERLVVFKNDKNPHHSIVLKNLEHICKNGVTNWLEEQHIRWSCRGCGTKFSWYDKICTSCGEKVYNCQDEEKDLLNLTKE